MVCCYKETFVQALQKQFNGVTRVWRQILIEFIFEVT